MVEERNMVQSVFLSKQTPPMESNLQLLDLPREIFAPVAEFLDIRDAFSFSRSCRTVHSAFPMVTLSPPLQLLPARQFFGELREDRNRQGPEIPVILGSRTHSIILETRWRDQGWGNSKGVLFIVAHDCHASNKDIGDFSRGRLVKASPLVAHMEARLVMTFRPKPAEVYHVWMHVGGGGGHELQFTTPLMMHTIVFDSERRTLSRAYHSLQRAAAVPAPGATNASDFWPGLLHAATRSLTEQMRRNEPMDPFLARYLQSHGFDLDHQSLEALGELCARFGNVSLK